MKKLIYFSFSFCLWLLSISALAQYVRITRDAACGLYKGEILMVSDTLYNKDGKLATPKYGKIKILGFTDKYNANSNSNKGSNFQKDSLYDILQDASDLASVHFKGVDGVDRWNVSGLEIERVQTGYMADSSQLYYKAYLSDSIYWFVSTKDAEKYISKEGVSSSKAKDVLAASYNEGNDVYIVCADSGRVAIEGIAKPFIINGGEETKIANVSGKKLRFILKDGLSFVIPYEDFEQKGEPTMQEIIAYVLIIFLLLLIICLIWKYKKQLLNWLRKISGKKSNEETKDLPALSPTGELQDQQTLQSVDDSKEGLVFNEKSDKEGDIESIQSNLDKISQFINEVKKLIEEDVKPTLTPFKEKLLSLDEPKNLYLDELKMFIGQKIEEQNSAIKNFITEDVKTVLTPFISQNEKPLSLADLNINLEKLKTSIEEKIEKNTLAVKSIGEISKERSDKEMNELRVEKEKLLEKINKLEKQEFNSSDFIKNGVKVEGCDSFVGFADNFLSICQDAEGDIYFRLKKMSIDERVKAEPILSEYYQTRPTLMIEKWKGILATLKMCGYVSDALIEAKNSKEREKYMQDYFFKEVVRPYVSALLICLERFRTGEYINLKLDDSFVVALKQNIEEIIQICHINEIEVIYQRLFEELNVVGEQYNNFEITKQKPDDKLSNWLDDKGALKNNLLLSVSEYAVNSITTERGYSTPQKTKCTVLDI